MDRWAKLYEKFQSVESVRVAREREAEERRAAFEQWCRVSTEQALQAVVAGLKVRAEEFRFHTGEEIKVEAHERGAAQLSDGRPSMSFVRVALATARVDLYAYREPSSLPVLHIVRSQKDHPSMLRYVDVVVSVPTCAVVQTTSGGWGLRRVGRGGKPDAQAAAMDVDELVFEIFEALVEMHTRAIVHSS